jgi:NadR type nicotinamide-nucleotide adenylyltransferase
LDFFPGEKKHMKHQSPNTLLKIVVIGPESTGKSTLCESLSKHFETDWCREYARAFLLEHGTDYTFDDLLKVAEGQLRAEDDCVLQMQSQQRSMVFIDTDMYVMKVWCEFVFGKCHPFILNQIIDRKYDGYLLCKPDLPWVKDELREYPDLKTRELLYHHYKDLLINQSTPWFEVNGIDPVRTNDAIAWVEKLRSTIH